METKFFHDYISTSMLLSDEVLLEMEQLAEQYPWFALAQQLILENYHATGNARRNEYRTRAALCAPSREHLFHRLFRDEIKEIISHQELSLQNDTLLEMTDEQKESAKGSKNERIISFSEDDQTTRKLVLTGSDYFAADEFTVDTTFDDPIAQFIISKPKINPYTSPLLGITIEGSVAVIQPLEEFDIVTETLAKIYAEQGFISLAVNAYEKLILRDREKSAYFADCIKQIKFKNKH